MNRKYRLSTALDVDDILMECTSYAIRLANEKYKFDPPLTIYEVNGWGKLGTRADVIFEYFDEQHGTEDLGAILELLGYDVEYLNDGTLWAYW
jgi:hypothetical protein